MKTKVFGIALMLILISTTAGLGAAQNGPPNRAERTPTQEHPVLMTQPSLSNSSDKRQELVVRGRVLDASRYPQAGLTVEAALPGGSVAAVVRSEAGGRFAIAGLELGEYHLRVLDAGGRALPLSNDSAESVMSSETQRPNFHELVLEVVAPGRGLLTPEKRPNTPIGWGAAYQTAPVSPDSIQSTGQITGVVTAEDTGLPLAYASVYAFDEDHNYLTSVNADIHGVYALTGLNTGKTIIHFQTYDQNYKPEWYNNKPDPETADLVSVVDGETTPNINAALGIGGEIAGRVTAEDTGLPLENVVIAVYDQDGFIYVASTDASGTYLISGLPAGNCKVRFVTSYQVEYVEEYYNDKTDFASADRVYVTVGSETSNIDAELARGGKITGQVNADDTGLPLQDVYVDIYDAHWVNIMSTSVSASGTYTVTGLASGSYRLFCSPYANGSSADYIDEFYANRYSLETADPVPVIAPDTTGSVDISLGRGGRITGQVTTRGSGVPIQDLDVTLYTVSDNYVESVNTNASGIYTLTGVMSGVYKLLFEPDENGPFGEYVPEYYDDKLDLDNADIVNVSAPDTTNGIDAELALGGKITGQVIADDTQLPLEYVDVDIYNSGGDWINDTSTDANGQYTVTHLASGSYFLHFQPSDTDLEYVPEYYNDRQELESADPVAVVAPNIVSGIDASLLLGGGITGRVSSEDTRQSLPDVSVFVYNCYGSILASADTDASGTYTVTGLIPGGYSVQYAPNDNGASRAYLDEFFDGKATWAGSNTVMVEAGETTTGVDAALARGAQISGRITAADGGASLEDVDIEIYSSSGGYIGSTWTGATGVYTTTGLPAGDYYLWFNPDRWSVSKDYVQEYYNDQPSIEAVDVLHLTPPVNRTGTDAVLQRGGKISGRLTAEGSGAALYDAWVDAYNPDTGTWDDARVDNGGYYTLSGLGSGQYEVDFYPDGDNAQYVWEYYNDKTPKQTPDRVTVSAPGEVTGIDAILVLGGAIECSVYAEDTQEPLEEVRVDAYDSDGDWFVSAWTDRDGQCTLSGLPSGEYRLAFESTIAYVNEACLIRQILYEPEYYDDQPDLDSADPISISAPEIVTGIEAYLSVGQLLPPIGRGTVFLPMVSR